MMSKK
jgi:4-hydroxy-tetrahydrodipicolinate synthase